MNNQIHLLRKIIVSSLCIIFCVIGLFLVGCSSEPAVKWIRVESTSITGEDPIGDYTYEVGEDWEEGVNPGSYFPTGFVKNDNQTMVSANTATTYYTDYTTKHIIESLDDQYDYIQMNSFIDKNGDYSQTFTNIQKGTIGDYACVKGEFIGNGLGDNNAKGYQIVFFTSSSTYGSIFVYYTEAATEYKNELLHVVDSVQLEDGSKPNYTGSMDITTDDNDDTELMAVIAEARSLNEADYTSSSWEIFKSALEPAISISTNATAHQSDYAKKQYDLEVAMEQLLEAPKPEDYEVVPYQDLARNPDSYKGKKIAVTGRVLQVSEGSTENQIRVATSGRYDDVVMVGYSPSILTSRVLDDDNITAYGTYVGIYTYSAVSGASISVPALYADAIAIS